MSNYLFLELFKEAVFSKERILAENYVISLDLKEDPHISDQKYWDYFHHLNEARRFDEGLHGKLMKIHEEERAKNGGLRLA